MSIIYSLLAIFFLASIISAIRAPPDVYSATIHNAKDSSIQCKIIWSQPEGDALESALFTIEKNQDYLTDEKIIDVGSWQARAIIQEVHCGKLILKAPFDGVESPKTNWKFTVQSDQIVSGQ